MAYIVEVPACLSWKDGELVPGRGEAGWTIFRFLSAQAAAEFVQAHPQAAMPCWRRFVVANGKLTQAR